MSAMIQAFESKWDINWPCRPSYEFDWKELATQKHRTCILEHLGTIPIVSCARPPEARREKRLKVLADCFYKSALECPQTGRQKAMEYMGTLESLSIPSDTKVYSTRNGLIVIDTRKLTETWAESNWKHNIRFSINRELPRYNACSPLYAALGIELPRKEAQRSRNQFAHTAFGKYAQYLAAIKKQRNENKTPDVIAAEFAEKDRTKDISPEMIQRHIRKARQFISSGCPF